MNYRVFLIKLFSPIRAAACALALSATGCATAPEEIPTAAELYAEAHELTKAANYVAGDEKFDELKSTYPTSPYAQQAVLDQIHGYLARREYGLAVSAADEFINLYPDHPETPYAIYMKGVIYFRENRGILDRIGRQDPSKRDPQLMWLSYEAFKSLVDTYPDSKYAADASNRMRYLINSLAKNEIHVARYYYEQKAYPSAIARAKNVIETYPDSTSLEAALALLYKAYGDAGFTGAADDTRRLIELNFPDSAIISAE